MADEADGYDLRDEGDFENGGEPTFVGAGDMLREARLAAGYDLAKVAGETRIPQRHLESIESGDFNALPAKTYAVGFSRTYAKMLGLDHEDIVARVRDEMGMHPKDSGNHPAKFEPGDPARVPSRGLAWFGVIAALLLLGGIYAFYNTYLSPGMGPAPLADEREVVASASATPAATASPAAVDASGEVVFTALADGIWAKFYDASGTRIYEAQMAEGERFVVPADADGPQIWTGRPDAFAITVGGKPVPKLADEDFIMKDQPISAQALLSRPQSPSPASTVPAGTPTAGAAARTAETM